MSRTPPWSAWLIHNENKPRTTNHLVSESGRRHNELFLTHLEKNRLAGALVGVYWWLVAALRRRFARLVMPPGRERRPYRSSFNIPFVAYRNAARACHLHWNLKVSGYNHQADKLGACSVSRA